MLHIRASEEGGQQRPAKREKITHHHFLTKRRSLKHWRNHILTMKSKTNVLDFSTGKSRHWILTAGNSFRVVLMPLCAPYSVLQWSSRKKDHEFVFLFWQKIVSCNAQRRSGIFFWELQLFYSHIRIFSELWHTKNGWRKFRIIGYRQLFPWNPSLPRRLLFQTSIKSPCRNSSAPIDFGIIS